MHARVSTSAPPGRPPIVFVHGLGVSSRYMVPLARALASEFPVHAVDLPGFGLSTKPPRALPVAELGRALSEWLLGRGLEHAVVVANSFGCQVVAELVTAYAPPVQGVVLLAPTVDPEARSIVKHLGRWILTVPWEKPSLAPVIAIDYMAAGLSRVQRTSRFAEDDRIETKLPRIEAPVLVVRGSRDSVVPQRWAEAAAALPPHGRLELLRGAGHCLNFSAAQETAALVRSFVAETAPPPLGQPPSA